VALGAELLLYGTVLFYQPVTDDVMIGSRKKNPCLYNGHFKPILEIVIFSKAGDSYLFQG